MSTHRGRTLTAATALAALLSACTSLNPAADPEPSTSQQAAAPSPALTGTARPATPRQPLVLAVNIHRLAVDVPVRLARRIAAGEPTTWAQLGQPGGRVLVRTGAGALNAVERDKAVLAIVPAWRVGPTVQAVSVGGAHPLRDPAGYPLTTGARRAVPAVNTMIIVGDIMLGRGVADVAEAAGDPSAPLRPLQQRLAHAELTVGNLESTLSRAGPPQQGGDSFAADPAVLEGLADAGFDLLSLANNHTGDYGPDALLQTVRRVRRSPIRSVGAGRDIHRARRPVVLGRNGTSFGFVAFNAIGETPRATRIQPGAAAVRMQPRTGPLNPSDLHRLTSTVTRLSRRVDVVVVLPHWGDQYTHTPVPDQRRVGLAMVDAGADIVVGGHPHWVQGIQVHDDHLVAHSLGNFVFDMDFSQETQEGVMLELVFWGAELMAVDFTAYVIGPDYAPRLADRPRTKAILATVWAASDPPFSF